MKHEKRLKLTQLNIRGFTTSHARDVRGGDICTGFHGSSTSTRFSLNPDECV